MNLQEIKQFLSGYGLEEKEAVLYLAALNSGETGMTELAKNAKLKRSTAYLIFQALEKKGLMGSFKMKKGLRFVATGPEILLAKTENQLSELKNILPQLRAFSRKNPEDPKVTYYHGEEGYITALSDSLKKPNILLRHIGSITEAHKIYKEYDFNYYIPERLRKNISIRCIYTNDVSEDVKNKNHTSEKREIRYVPKEYPLKTAMLIYENKVIITSTRNELISIVIESEDIAETERLKFDLIWDGLKKF